MDRPDLLEGGLRRDPVHVGDVPVERDAVELDVVEAGLPLAAPLPRVAGDESGEAVLGVALADPVVHLAEVVEQLELVVPEITVVGGSSETSARANSR